MKAASGEYRFVLPNIQKKIIGTQGEQARYIPYRLEEGVSPQSILRELRRQPHMADLAAHLDKGRRLYLLEGGDVEQLLLAAEYIGTYHRLADCACGEDCEDEDGEAENWEDGDTNRRTFDFSEGIPFLMSKEAEQFYFPHEGFGFGGGMYLPDRTPQKRPWWTMSDEAPLVLSLVDPEADPDCFFMTPLSSLPRLLGNLRERSLIIVLFYNAELKRGALEEEGGGDFVSSGQAMTMEDLSFELEAECIRLGVPDQESRYKRDILRQLARAGDAPLVRGASALRILSLVEEHRGDVDNRTLSKAVSNALRRRGAPGPLREGDFAYLASVFPSRRPRRALEEDAAEELVGQPEIRRQLARTVDSMAFQQQRKKAGLPCSPIHYTFAFMGAPGTGKTSWAKWLAKEMRSRGLLRDSGIICINAAELKAKYVGHTTGKVKALFQQYGVIILDEAYSLAEGEGDDCFAREALAQLCVELEEHGEDRLVIFAGYGGASDPRDNRMLRFLQSNPGINSRVAFKVSFPDFAPGELTEVLRSMLTRERYVLPPEAEALAEDFFRQRMRYRAFGNCREVRNLADRIKLQLAARQAGREGLDRESLSRVLPQDVEAAVREILDEYRALERDGGRSIGFSGGRAGQISKE